MILFCFLNNYLYFTDYDSNGNYKYLEQENLNLTKKQLQENMKKYDSNNTSKDTTYIDIKTKIDIIKLREKFAPNSWQQHIIKNSLYDILYQINYYNYLEKNEEQLINSKEKYNILKEQLENDNLSYFLKKDIELINEELEKLEEEYANIKDEKLKKDLSIQIKEIKINLKILNYKLNNNIKESDNYLNNALKTYQENYKILESYNQLTRKKTHAEKIELNATISRLKISKYVIENKININKQNTLNYQLRTIIEDYEIFIVILILIISSTIICDEFKDGTIKLLLIKPYSRGKILLSKFLTATSVIILTILILIIAQLIIGGIILGFDSLNIPVVVYDFTWGKLVEYNIFHYMIIRIITRIPFLLILILLTFLISIITNNVAVSITLPLMLYMFTQTFEYLTIQYQLEFMKYLVNLNWNLQSYLFGNLNKIPYIDLKFSIIILLVYFIIMGILSYILFKNKNIKNI